MARLKRTVCPFGLFHSLKPYFMRSFRMVLDNYVIFFKSLFVQVKLKDLKGGLGPLGIYL